MLGACSRLATGRHSYANDWYSWQDPEVPARLSPTWYLLDSHIEAGRGTKTALIVDEDRYTYRGLLDCVERVASGLRELGVPRGSRLLMVGTDSVEFVVLWLACVRVGVVPVAVSDATKAPQLAYYLRDAEPWALYLDAQQVPKYLGVLDDLDSVPELVLVRGQLDAGAASVIPAVSMDMLLAATPSAAEAALLHANDIAYMLYTGSTTGPAKGVTHLAHDFLLVPERQGAFWEYKSSDVVHATSKKYFTHGLWPGVLIPLYWGATAVISGRPARGGTVAGIIERHRPNKLITTPTVVKEILHHVDETGARPDFSSIRLVVTASEQVPDEIVERFRTLFDLELLDSIGSSEVTYEWIANRPKDHRRGTLGRPVFGCEVKLVAKDGTEITDAGVPGEAWVRSRTACLFYWRKYDSSRATFVGSWTRTGDMLKLTEDGFFEFVGRRDDLFKVSGMWVSPVEVENAIAASPSVHEVAVIGATGESGLVEPRAFVVLRPGREPSDETTAELRARVREIGGYKVPDQIIYVTSLPHTPSGKIHRHALRDLATSASWSTGLGKECAK
jgi:benzoate-CoA ligase